MMRKRKLILPYAQGLINQGKFRKALRTLKTVEEYLYDQRKDVHFWLAIHLTALLTGDRRTAKQAQEAARNCPNYLPEHEGDILRDIGLRFLRLGRFDEALQTFKNAAPYHTSPNRQAVLVMCNGRHAAATGSYTEALACFREANELWAQAGNDADRQWIMNNRFHQLKALAAAGQNVTKIAQIVIETDPSRVRRMRAYVISRLGRFGNRLDDITAKLLGH